MKWLKIKKYLKIFSVIICSIFIFSNKASASNANLEYNFYTKEYNKNIINYFNEYDIDIVSQLNDLISYYESNLDEEFLVFFNLDGYYFNISIYIFDDINKFKNFNFYNYSKSKNLDLSFSYDKYNEPNNILFSNYINGQDNWSFDNINYIIDNLKNKLDNWIINKNWNTSNLFYDSFRYGGFNFSDYNTFNDNSNLLIYSSFDIKYNINSSGNNDFIKVKINDSFILDNESSLKEFINSYSFLNKKEFTIPGYKKVVIPADKQYAIISGVKTGRVYYKANSQISSYYDKSNREWGSIDWPKAITDLRKAVFNDNPNNPHLNSLYLYYDFDLSQVQDSQFILIEKYHEKVCNLPDETIEECNDRYNYEQEIWIPDNADIYFSFIDVKPNENGGNDFDFDYKNPETGDINNSHTENDSSPDNEVGTFFDYLYKLLNNFQSGFIYISECFTNFFNELPFMIQAILGLAFTIGIVKFIIDLFK